MTATSKIRGPVLVLLLALSACTGSEDRVSQARDRAQSQARLPDQVTHNPPYDPADIQAGLARGDQISGGPLLRPDHDRVIDSLMSGGVRPPDVDKVYYVIVLNRNGLLTLRLDGHREAVLVFTSEARAKHYLTEARDLDIDGEVGLVNFAATDWESFVQSWLAIGKTNLLIDKCPYCEAFAVYKLNTHMKTDDWVRLCAVVRATRILQYNFCLDEATRLLAEGDVQAARRVGEHIVTYIDAERPEVHLLLARCGLASKDKELVRRKRAVLEFFGPEWLAKLEDLRK